MSRANSFSVGDPATRYPFKRLLDFLERMTMTISVLGPERGGFQDTYDVPCLVSHEEGCPQVRAEE